MLYHLVKTLSLHFDIPGVGMFLSLSFRAAMGIILALIIGMIFGKRIIRMLQRHQIGEEIRNLGLEGQLQKRGTPTMGGIIILASILIPILLFGDLTNIYVLLMIISTVWLGLIGFLDDYIKVFRKNKEGLNGRFKIIGQVGLGIIVGLVMWFRPRVGVKQKVARTAPDAQIEYVNDNGTRAAVYMGPAEKTAKTTIPFVKNNEFDYHWLIPGDGPVSDTLGWIFYVLVAIFVITAVSNGANLTDGLDGLAAGVSATIVVILGVLAWLSGNVIYADYLNLMYIPSTGELVVFAAAFAGALLGFLWYNCYPAQVFMGDTGSLAIGGIIAVFALSIRKELLLPLLCGIFLVEAVSVIIQRGWFKYTKHKYGEGRRVFLMAPIHHHFELCGWSETRVVGVFSIITAILCLIAYLGL